MKNIKNKVRAIIFDMDGTIVDSENIWDNAIQQLLVKRNIVTTPKQYQLLATFAGCGLYPCAEILKKEFNISASIDEIVNEAKNNAFEHFKKGIPFISGFENFHKKLQTYLIPTSIATNADELSVKALSNSLNLAKFFGKNIYHIGLVENKAKPNPAIFLHAAKKLNVNPKECIVFEDSLFGFQAAKAAGMKCIAIKNEKNKNILNHVDGAINSYSEAEEELIKIIS